MKKPVPFLKQVLRQPWSQRARIIGMSIVAVTLMVVIGIFILFYPHVTNKPVTSRPMVTSKPNVKKPVSLAPKQQQTQPPQATVQKNWWQPGTESLPWQWVLNHSLDLANAQDAGTNSVTYQGNAAAKPVVYDIDGFMNTAELVTAIHARSAHAICYIEVGALENYRPDANLFPAAALGESVPNYPDEKYLDITNATVISIIKSRIAMCHSKGFDAVEPDIDDSYGMNTGFSISETNEVGYLTNLANYAHSLGMAWGLKNGADAGDPGSFVAAMLPSIDFAVVEEPFYLHTIGVFSPALFNASKAVFVAEYTNDTTSASSFCTQALASHVNAALFSVDLDASTRTTCY